MNPAHGSWMELGMVDPASLTEDRLLLHHAVQALSAFCQALLEPADDDSHRSLTWHVEGRAFCTPETEDGLRASLNVPAFRLDLRRGGERVRSLELRGRAPADALGWLGDAVGEERGAGLVPLAWPEYDLPPLPSLPGDGLDPDARALGELARWYHDAQSLLEPLSQASAEASPVRCWPHHFDLAVLHTIRGDDADGDRFVGVGLSPGDGGYPLPYLYVNAWPPPAPQELPPLDPPGRWHTQGWIGAVLRGDEIVDAGEAAAQAERVADFVARATAAARAALG